MFHTNIVSLVSVRRLPHIFCLNKHGAICICWIERGIAIHNPLCSCWWRHNPYWLDYLCQWAFKRSHNNPRSVHQFSLRGYFGINGSGCYAPWWLYVYLVDIFLICRIYRNYYRFLPVSLLNQDLLYIFLGAWLLDYYN